MVSLQRCRLLALSQEESRLRALEFFLFFSSFALFSIVIRHSSIELSKSCMSRGWQRVDLLENSFVFKIHLRTNVLRFPMSSSTLPGSVFTLRWTRNFICMYIAVYIRPAPFPLALSCPYIGKEEDENSPEQDKGTLFSLSSSFFPSSSPSSSRTARKREECPAELVVRASVCVNVWTSLHPFTKISHPVLLALVLATTGIVSHRSSRENERECPGENRRTWWQVTMMKKRKGKKEKGENTSAGEKNVSSVLVCYVSSFLFLF